MISSALQDFPLLPVAILLLAVLGLLLLRKGPMVRLVAIGASLLSLAGSALLTLTVFREGPAAFRLGGIAPSFGIDFRIDFANAIAMLLVAFAIVIFISFISQFFQSANGVSQSPLLNGLALGAGGLLMGLTSTEAAFNLFVFLGFASLSGDALMAVGETGEAIRTSTSFISQLPVLPVIVPLIAAPLTLLMRPGKTPWLWATLVSWVTLVLTLLLLETVWHEGVISYDLGGWASPLGIVYRVDLANALVLTLVAFVAAIVFPYAYHSVEDEINRLQTPAFYTALQICFAGLMGVTITGDAFNVFVFLEISSLSTYALVAMGAARDRRALTASFNYLIMGTIGATFFVIGIGLLYQATGTLNMMDINARMSDGANRVIQAGFAFIVTGIGLKLAMVPLHLWLPNAYSFAPSAVSAFIAATATKVSVYVMLRFLFTVFGFEFEFIDVALNFFIFLGLLGMFYASLIAVFREDVKQLLAYSSVAQIGYMLLGISFGTAAGVSAAFIHLFNHGLMKAALFMGVGCVVWKTGSHHISAFRGLMKTMPWTAWGIIISGLSLAGIPLTAGFISKWYLVSAALDTATIIPSWLIVLAILLSSLLAVIYVGRIIYVMWLEEPPEGTSPGEAPYMMRFALWLMVLANIWFGIQSDPIVYIANGAAEQLTRTGLGFGGAW